MSHAPVRKLLSLGACPPGPVRIAMSLTAISLTACVFGYRGEATFEATYPVDEIDVVRVDLGATPLTIVGDDMAPGLELTGTWRSIGGNARLAREQALAPSITWTADARFAELLAVVPLAAQGQVDFEVDEIRLPPTLDLDLETALGDVSILAVEGNISADIGVGRVQIEGGAGGVAVRTGAGDLEIASTGSIDASTGNGGARIWQEGAGGNDIVVDVRRGDIEIALRSDANLDLQLRGREIRVRTGTVSTVSSGEFSRKVGGGSVKIWADAQGGDVTVELRDAP